MVGPYTGADAVYFLFNQIKAILYRGGRYRLKVHRLKMSVAGMKKQFHKASQVQLHHITLVMRCSRCYRCFNLLFQLCLHLFALTLQKQKQPCMVFFYVLLLLLTAFPFFRGRHSESL